MPKRKRLIRDNLARALPDVPDERRRAIAEAVWKNLGRAAVEFIRVSDVTQGNFSNSFVYEGLENVERAAAKGKGIIFIALHFSSWELNGIALQYQLKNLVAIARPMKNPFVEEWVQKKRQQGGMEIILHRQAVKASLRALKDKKSVGILMDQNLYTGGVFVNFMGRPAATTTLPALLHDRTGAPVILTYNLRENGRLRIFFEKPVTFPEIADAGERMQCWTQILSDKMSDLVRKYPENWFWIHNRWKRQPDSSPGTGEVRWGE
jgi:KDO2-lipid IV(A) lauroyltransferase